MEECYQALLTGQDQSSPQSVVPWPLKGMEHLRV